MKKFVVLFLVLPVLLAAFAGCTENGSSGPTGAPSGGGSGEGPGGPLGLGSFYLDNFDDGNLNNMVEPYKNPWSKYVTGASIGDISFFGLITDNEPDEAPPAAPPQGPIPAPDPTENKILSVTASLLPSSEVDMVIRSAGAVTKIASFPVNLDYYYIEFLAKCPEGFAYGLVTITDDIGRKCYYFYQVYPWWSWEGEWASDFNTLPNAGYSTSDVVERAMFISFSIVNPGMLGGPPPESPEPIVPGNLSPSVFTLQLDNIYFYED